MPDFDPKKVKLGKRPPTPERKRLRFKDYFTGVVPAAPPATDYFNRVPTWILGANDRFGTCGPTSVANDRLQVTTYLTGTPQVGTDDDVFDLYRRSGNPNFDPATGADDNGVNMQTMLEAVVSGGFAGTKALGFAQVDHTNLEEMRAAIAIFGSLLLGVVLEVPQQSQTGQRLWDYVPGAVWGGHAIMNGRYSTPDGRTGVISWQLVVDATDAFLMHQLDEAWVVIWPEHLGSVAFLQGVDLATLAADYEALTGRPFPAVVPPTPTPTPPPPPTPTPTPTGCATQTLLLLRAFLIASAIVTAANIAVGALLFR